MPRRRKDDGDSLALKGLGFAAFTLGMRAVELDDALAVVREQHAKGVKLAQTVVNVGVAAVDAAVDAAAGRGNRG